MEYTLNDIRCEMLDRLIKTFEKANPQPHIGIILRRGTIVQKIVMYDSELIENKNRLDAFFTEKTQDAAMMLNGGRVKI